MAMHARSLPPPKGGCGRDDVFKTTSKTADTSVRSTLPTISVGIDFDLTRRQHWQVGVLRIAPDYLEAFAFFFRAPG